MGRLTCIVDHNGYQQTGPVPEVMPLDPIVVKWHAFGWDALAIDGNEMAEVCEALNAAREPRGRPLAIVANTVKGKGVSFVEADYTYHGKALAPDEAERALEELGWR